MGYASISPLGGLSKKDIIVLYSFLYYLPVELRTCKKLQKEIHCCVPFGNDLDLVHCSYN